jgi:hypothetical protein
MYASPKRGRGECRVLDAPAASYAKNRKHTSVVTTGSPVSPGIPARNGFNGFLRALLGDRLVCHRRWRKCFRQLDAGIEASGPHDFAVRLRAVRQQHVSVHRIPPRVRDDRDTPLEWDETGIAIFLFLPTRQAKVRKFRNPPLWRSGSHHSLILGVASHRGRHLATPLRERLGSPSRSNPMETRHARTHSKCRTLFQASL